MTVTVQSATTPRRNFEAAEKIIRAIDSQLRMKILYLLHDQPRCVHELVDVLGSSQPLISQHLKVLRTAGLVESTRNGREMYYSLTSIDAIALLEMTFSIVDAPTEDLL